MTCQTTVRAAFKMPCLYLRLCSSGTGKFCPSEFLITLFTLWEAAKALILN